jgi:hypothetical protein
MGKSDIKIPKSAVKKRETMRVRLCNRMEIGMEHIPQNERMRCFADNGATQGVAVYMRTGNCDTAQHEGFHLQQAFYEDFVGRQKNWRLVAIYCDSGRAGTGARNREQFNRLIADCMKGDSGITLIITRSISRFSRDIKEVQSTLRMLAGVNPPIGVFFELENLYSLDVTRNLFDLLAIDGGYLEVDESHGKPW